MVPYHIKDFFTKIDTVEQQKDIKRLTLTAFIDGKKSSAKERYFNIYIGPYIDRDMTLRFMSKEVGYLKQLQKINPTWAIRFTGVPEYEFYDIMRIYIRKYMITDAISNLQNGDCNIFQNETTLPGKNVFDFVYNSNSIPNEINEELKEIIAGNKECIKIFQKASERQEMIEMFHEISYHDYYIREIEVKQQEAIQVKKEMLPKEKQFSLTTHTNVYKK